MFYSWRSLVLMAVDAILLHLSLFFALLIRFDGQIPGNYINTYWQIAPFSTIIMMVLFFAFGLYRRAWEYASIGELMAVIRGVTLGSILTVLLAYLYSGSTFPLPRSVYLLDFILRIVFIGGSRITWRLIRDNHLGGKKKSADKKVMICGAGDAGVLVAKELKSHYNGSVEIVGFVDDDHCKKNMIIQEISVLGGREDIPHLVKKHQVDEVIIAMPSADIQVKKEILGICKNAGVKVKILPGVYDLIDGKVKVSQIRDVEVEDLLGREPVQVNMDDITAYLKDQVVLITGGGGSIGSELCRQVAHYQPKTLLIFDSCENNVYEIDMELKKSFPHLKIVPMVKNVQDRKALINTFMKYRPQIVFHAAAHKHVPMMEYNPEDAIKNNVLGTYNVAQAADMFHAKKFVFISTDKAVNPTSIMGATKRLGEMVIQYLDTISETSYVAVRFGNVLGSKGSVIPLFKKQIANGGPVTVTHQEMVRYFMTIPEAVQLVIQAGSMAKGGEIFILDMGEPVRIMDLAYSLIELSGFRPGKDIEIKVTGTRPGEKLYEELLTAEEGVTATAHKRIFVAKRGEIMSELIEEKIIGRIMRGNLPENENETQHMIQEFLPSFRSHTIEAPITANEVS
ncbi:nucleoside-diphosphate sugar epimerase/dehydratase [Dehalobacterium formicoaceticum]|uniref:nucleoside-diphosphate sugar epimerase/dehydratase n=1 Tax=Dehalobacterium formicoaceticum TaxID=51515 RepID=UPI0031F65269